MRLGPRSLGLGRLAEAVQEQRMGETARQLAELSERLAGVSEALAKRSKVAKDDDRLTSKEVAPLLGVLHHKTVEVWARPCGQKGGRGLPCVRYGRSLRFIRGAVLAWRAQQES